ncbi:serine/threonine-protein phosphatase [Acidipila sp. EB88]|nr:serine/threonine-protein phosphatase [Acidipila sp. EB88]
MTPASSFLLPDGSTLALEQQVVRLQALLEASRRVHSTILLDQVLREALRIAILELELEGARFVGCEHCAEVSAGDMLPQQASGSRDYPRFPVHTPAGELIAELVVAPPQGRALTLYESDFLEGLMLQTALAAENALHHKRNLEYARLTQDLDAARLIQQSLLPQVLPALQGYAVAVRSSMCYQVGGDYLDVIPEPAGTLLLVVADVAGKGLASALICMVFRAAFRALALQGLPLEHLAARLSQQHWEEGAEARRRYVTAIFVRLDPAAATITCVNAGHNPGLLLAPNNTSRWIKASGTPLGMLSGTQYESEQLDFPLGGRMLLYTDGLTEAFCAEEEFGAERLAQLFADCSGHSCEATLSTIWRELLEFTGHTPQGDDMSAIALGHTGGGTLQESA